MNKLKIVFKQLFLGKDLRSANANKNTLFMLLLRGVNILISFMYVPLLIHTFSSYRYGIWLTITSIVTWMNLFDVGLGNGLRNRLSESIAKDDKNESKYLISTAYASISILSLILVFLYFIITYNLDWSVILNVPESMRQEVTELVNMVFVLFSIQFALSIINAMLLAFQKPAYSSLIMTLGQILSFGLVSFFVLVLKESSLFNLGLIISLSPIIVLIVFTIYIFSKKYRPLSPNMNFVKFSYLNKILGLGLKFFVLQIITIILFQTSNIIIAQNVGQEGVTEYNIAYKYLGLIYFVFTIVVTPYWSASTDAYTRSDFDWIKQSVRKLNLIWLLLSFVGLCMLISSNFVYKMWLGKSISANYLTLSFAFIYFISLTRYSIYSYILNGMGKIFIQMIITSIVAIVYIPLTILMAKNYGVNGVFFSLIITALINLTWSSIQFNKIINGKAFGLWIK
jgi:O-antigen/teichoic acid export membrane protein